ncbi:metallophosphoesterase family protein [Chengkuizengella sediminis]|uniref:metallophosphoesterase family protein n=1 Tax=Chengkuizengella sediminis TaxID=1885917 RepID=UPI001389A459|nr:DNA repair exonuclease [Chengkuizengella sediminis]NDI36440.1 DNA repair exonuclease [Chengkuizengella sediminis]
MKSFRFIHAADLHLDSPFKGYMNIPSKEITSYIKNSTFIALQTMVDLAIREKVQFVVLSGDIFDLADRSLRAQIRFQKEMLRLGENNIQVFIIHGNHDPEDGSRADLKWPDHVHFFPSNQVEMIPALDRNGQEIAHIYGISYPTRSVTSNLTEKFNIKDVNQYNIALLHTNLDGNPAHDNYAPSHKEDLLKLAVNYWALGHIHTRQIVHEEPHIVYPGNIQGRSVRELGERGCYIVDVDETRTTKLTFVALEAVRWIHNKINIADLKSEQDLKDAVDLQLKMLDEEKDNKPTIARFTFEGYGPLHHFLNEDVNVKELLMEYQEKYTLESIKVDRSFVWIESFKIKTSPEISKDQYMDDSHYLGDLLRISQHLLNDSNQLQAFNEEALFSMKSHLKAGKYLREMDSEQQRIEWLKTAEELVLHLLLEEVK